MVIESARAARKRNAGDGPGIFLKAQNPGRLAEWYREQPGIAPESAGEEGASHDYPLKWKEKDPPDREGISVRSVSPDTARYLGSGQAPFAINERVANLDRLLSQLPQEGLEVDDKVDHEASGKFAWATDPEGNRFRLWKPTEEQANGGRSPRSLLDLDEGRRRLGVPGAVGRRKGVGRRFVG
jgi:hypothetical protein